MSGGPVSYTTLWIWLGKRRRRGHGDDFIQMRMGWLLLARREEAGVGRPWRHPVENEQLQLVKTSARWRWCHAVGCCSAIEIRSHSSFFTSLLRRCT